MSALTFYRDSAAGSALVDALDELVTAGRLPPDLAVKVLEEVRGRVFFVFVFFCGGDERAMPHPKQTCSLSLFLSHPLSLFHSSQFDSVFASALATKVAARASFKARLDTYRFCDNVWTFVVSGVSFKIVADGSGGGGGGGGAAGAAGGDLPVPGKVRLVCVDSKVVEAEAGGGGEAGGGA